LRSNIKNIYQLKAYLQIQRILYLLLLISYAKVLKGALAIDGLRQDVLYPPELDKVQEGGKYRVNIAELSGIKQILEGYDQPLENQSYIMLPEITAVFPSITLASWASIFTGRMPSEPVYDGQGKIIDNKGTGILGNEFFARDLITYDTAEQKYKWETLIPAMDRNPAGMVTLSDGAFKKGIFELQALTPLSGNWEDSPQNNLLQIPTLYEGLEENSKFMSYFAEREGEQRVVVFQHYSRGADEWLTVNLGNLTEFGLAYLFKIFSDADLLDKVPGFNAEEWLDNNLLNEDFDRNETPFPGVFVLYFAGLDHEAHDVGMSGYTKFFRETTDDEIKDIVNWLKKYGELDNKIFIITTDHGFTEMPDFGQITLYPGTPDERVVTPDTSCELKVERFNKRKVQDAEKTNNNLHIWELGEVLRALEEKKVELNYRVLAPHVIAELFLDSPAGARENLNIESGLPDFANIVAAFNGPMAYIYLRGQDGWQSLPAADELTRFVEVLRVLFQIEDPLEAESALGIDMVDYLNLIENKVVRLKQSVDKILIRIDGEYLQFDGYGLNGYSLSPLSFSSEYIKALERIEGLNHPQRSGDIILIMRDKTSEQSEQRYSTGSACKSWHGSLNPSDSYVPFIVAYPGGNKYELEPHINNTEGCDTVQGCDGNWRVTDLIKTIIEKQYSSQ